MRSFLTTAIFFAALLSASLGLTACNDCDSCGSDKAPAADTEKATSEAPATGVNDAATQASEAAAAGDSEAACLCVMGLAGEALWCEKCDKGYIDGEPAHCRGCVAKAQKKAQEEAAEAAEKAQ